MPEALIKLVYDDLSMKLDNKYHYHNLHHTKRVINSAGKIGNHYNLSRDDWRDLLTACLLHDYGFIKSHIDHEETGSKISKELLPDFIIRRSYRVNILSNFNNKSCREAK